MDPDLFGVLKQNERVFLRITSEEPLGEGAAAVLRLRTLALSRWEGGVWKKPLERGVTVTPAGNAVLIPLASRGRAAAGSMSMTIDLTPIQTRSLPYPLLGSALRLSEGSFRNPNLAYVERDAARNVRLPTEPDRTIQYTALYGKRPLPDLEPGDAVEAGRPAGSKALRAFALETLAGIDPAADPEAAAGAIEAALQRWDYELDLKPRGPNAVEDFVVNRRKGHCQTFATAMALLLREVGVPTRFVTGFLGGEIGAFGRYVLVRGQNVHAWVEAWCGPSKGWVTFDPTPFRGQPRLERVPVSQRLRQVTDGLEFFYDRFILSYGQGDQVELLRQIREATGAALERPLPRSRVEGPASEPGRRRRGRGAAPFGARLLRAASARRALGDTRPGAGFGRLSPPSEGAPPRRGAAHAGVRPGRDAGLRGRARPSCRAPRGGDRPRLRPRVIRRPAGRRRRGNAAARASRRVPRGRKTASRAIIQIGDILPRTLTLFCDETGGMR